MFHDIDVEMSLISSRSPVRVSHIFIDASHDGFHYLCGGHDFYKQFRRTQSGNSKAYLRRLILCCKLQIVVDTVIFCVEHDARAL